MGKGGSRQQKSPMCTEEAPCGLSLLVTDNQSVLLSRNWQEVKQMEERFFKKRLAGSDQNVRAYTVAHQMLMVSLRAGPECNSSPIPILAESATADIIHCVI